ncbi:acyl-CoA carboxylase epsilon subunit [Corynebacterium otitidis]
MSPDIAVTAGNPTDEELAALIALAAAASDAPEARPAAPAARRPAWAKRGPRRWVTYRRG